MGKRVFACLWLILLAVFSVNAAFADTAAVSYELANCKKIYAYSGSAAAYFYGFHGSTLVSSRVIPDPLTRSVSVRGNILSVCHDDNHVCALYKASARSYRVVRLNMNSGDWVETEIPGESEILYRSFAVSQDEVFVIVAEGDRSCVRGIQSGATFTYRFSENIDRLFVCGDHAYARLTGGSIYRLNAGSSCLADGITDETERTLAAAQQLTVSAGDQTAVLHADLTLEIVKKQAVAAAPAADPAVTDSGFRLEGELLVVSPGVSVSQLKAAFAEATVRNADGSAVTNGRLKTGFTVQLPDGTYAAAVLGDVNGSGTVNSADTALLMRCFVGSETLSGCYRRAADENNDGQVDNRDLVLIARTSAS